MKTINRKTHILLFLTLIVSFLSSCTKVFYIASDTQDMAYVAEAYNQEHKKSQIIVYNVLEFSHILERKKVHYIVSHINTSKEKEFLNNSRFAPIEINSTENKKFNDMNLLSYALPFVIIRKDQTTDLLDSSRITQSQLKEISVRSLKKNELGLYNFGFYPVGDSFEKVFENSGEAQKFLIDAKLDSAEIKEYYKTHYGPAPLVGKLLDKKILYKYIPSNDFYKLPKSVQGQFNVFLLTDDEHNVAGVNHLYIGKVENSMKRSIQHSYASRGFIEWLFSTKGQSQIIAYMNEHILEDRMSVFIDQSFSTIWNINLDFLFKENAWLKKNQPQRINMRLY